MLPNFPLPMNYQQWDTLLSVCKVLLPIESHALDTNSDPAENLTKFEKDLALWLHQLPRPTLIRLLKFLNLLRSSWLQILGIRNLQGAPEKKKESVLLDFANSHIPNLRQGFQSIKRICMLLYYGNLDSAARKAYRQRIGYPDSARPVANQLRSTPESIAKPDLFYDAVIIGSGVGGGVVAKYLSHAGFRVLIVEKGGVPNPAADNGEEYASINHLYESNGNRTNHDNSLLVLAGNCLGGGSAINWQACISPPDDLLEQWNNESHISFFTEFYFKKKLNEAHSFFQSSHVKAHSSLNQTLLAGCNNTGYDTKHVKNNISVPENLQEEYARNGFTGFGDPGDLKFNTIKQGITPAIQNRAHLLTDTLAVRALHRNKKVYGVMLERAGEKILVECKMVVSCAGAIHTPALLKRTGLQHEQIGRNLYLHPVAPVAAMYEQEIKGWNGPPLSSVCHHFSRLNGNYGCIIETPPLHPGFLALAIPWKSAEQHASFMNQANHVAAFIVLTRDKFPGHLKFSATGQPFIHYSLRDFDLNHLLHGMAKACRIHFGAGAKSVHLLHQQSKTITDANANFEQLVHQYSWAPNRFTLYSAHQMGTCRMSDSNHGGPVMPDGMTREIENLYVADSSLFPSALGVNPMITIGALAIHVAEQIIHSHQAS